VKQKPQPSNLFLANPRHAPVLVHLLKVTTTHRNPEIKDVCSGLTFDYSKLIAIIRASTFTPLSAHFHLLIQTNTADGLPLHLLSGILSSL
jgi:hypothetical protein